MNDLPRELEAYLTDSDGEQASGEFRRKLYDQTESLLPNRSPGRHRQVLVAAACGPLFFGVLLLLGIWWILRSSAMPNEAAIVVPVVVVPVNDEAPAPAPAPSEPTTAITAPPASRTSLVRCPCSRRVTFWVTRTVRSTEARKREWQV